VPMLNSYYKWIFALRGKKVSRLRHRSARSQLFKQAPDSVLTGSSLFTDRRKELVRRVVRALRLVSGVALVAGLAWVGWESLKAFQIY